jgi:histidinol phosphatase-like enzyme (inositol monophosphatase family)
MDEAEARELWGTAAAAVDAARIETLAHFRTPLAVESKEAAFDPVTVADRAAEAAMRRVITARRPRDAILGEEEAPRAGSSGLSWVLDPIDGTRGYISGTPVWGILAAVSDADGPRLGIIDQPFTGERWEGGLGRARWSRGAVSRPLAVRGTGGLADATLLTTFPEIGSEAERAAFGRVATQARLVRYGLDCYAYGLLALGQVDLVIEAGLQPYDIAAPIAVVEAAGGILTDWTGGPAHGGGQALAAATPALHEAAMRALAGE